MAGSPSDWVITTCSQARQDRIVLARAPQTAPKLLRTFGISKEPVVKEKFFE